jgi:adenylate kinase family enzyme
MIRGATGSGKTTLAHGLAEVLHLPVIEMDAIRHTNGWDSVPWNEFRAKIAELLSLNREGWICEGNYSLVSDLLLAEAESIIWLHIPWRVSFWRLFKRTVRRAWTREPLYHENGPTESWRLTFTSRRSILWWSIGHHQEHVRNTRRLLQTGLPPQVTACVLKSEQDVRAFLEAVREGTASHSRAS